MRNKWLVLLCLAPLAAGCNTALRPPASQPAATQAPATEPAAGEAAAAPLPQGNDAPPGPPVRHILRIAEADQLYDAALRFYKTLPQNPDRARQAIERFNRVVREYPQSDKAADALFYGGEVLREFFDDQVRAAEYYQRAYQADPHLLHPAHFRRAGVLDYRLHRRADALEEYRNTLRFEADLPAPWAKVNADYAAARIQQLEKN